MDMKLNGWSHPQRTHSGFTLVELLVIVSALAILGIIHLTAMAAARQKTENLACMNNLRQLTTAWKAYASDNGGRFVIVPDDPITKAWVYGDMDYMGGTANTNLNYLTNASYALMGPYTRNARVYKCPTDMSQSLGRKGAPRIRSYSMNQAAGPGTDGTSRRSGMWLNGGSGHGPYKVFIKESDLSSIAPSQFWLFIDEHPDSINDGGFAVRMDTVSWVDFPSPLHDGGYCLSFFDGHVELQKLNNLVGVPSVIYSGIGSSITVPSNSDIVWLQARTSYKAQ